MQRSQEQEQGLGVYIADGIAMTLCKELKGIILVCRFLGFYVRVSGPPPVCNRGPNCCQWRLSASVCLSLGGSALSMFRDIQIPQHFRSSFFLLQVAWKSVLSICSRFSASSGHALLSSWVAMWMFDLLALRVPFGDNGTRVQGLLEGSYDLVSKAISTVRWLER